MQPWCSTSSSWPSATRRTLIQGGSMKSFAKITFVSALCVAGLPLFAAEGVLIVQKTTTGTRTVVHRTQIEKERVRAETVGANGGNPGDGVRRDQTGAHHRQSRPENVQRDDQGGTWIAWASRCRTPWRKCANRWPASTRAAGAVEAMMRGRAGGMSGVSKTEYRKAVHRQGGQVDLRQVPKVT